MAGPCAVGVLAQPAPRRRPVRSQQPVLLPVQATLDGICKDWDVIGSGENFFISIIIPPVDYYRP
jgi:hypothetical protein